MNWNPFLSFPRELGLPYRTGILLSKKDFIEKINLYNCKTTVFTSLYSFKELNEQKTRGVYSSAILDKIYLESDKGTVEPIKKLHEYCVSKDLVHCMFFSGRGFHFYIGTSGEVQNSKGAVTNAQMDICKECNLHIGINTDSDIDGHIIGNLAQMVRVPNTLNLKRHLYCIPLKEEDLISVDHIKQIAKQPRPGITVYGHKLLDLKPFDSEPQTAFYDSQISIEEPEINLESIQIDKFPMCIRAILSEKVIKHKARYLLILYLRDLGIPQSNTLAFLRTHLDAKTYTHCVVQERQPMWIYKRTDLQFPNCETLREWGFCKNDKCEGAGIY